MVTRQQNRQGLRENPQNDQSQSKPFYLTRQRKKEEETLQEELKEKLLCKKEAKAKQSKEAFMGALNLKRASPEEAMATAEKLTSIAVSTLETIALKASALLKSVLIKSTLNKSALMKKALRKTAFIRNALRIRTLRKMALTNSFEWKERKIKIKWHIIKNKKTIDFIDIYRALMCGNIFR